MARETLIQFLRTTRSALDAQKAAANLAVGEPYLITDENAIAVGTASDDYVDVSSDGANVAHYDDTSPNFSNGLQSEGYDVLTVNDAFISNVANTVVKRDSAGRINASSVLADYVALNYEAPTARTSDTIFFTSEYSMIRRNTASGFRQSLGVEPGVDVQVYDPDTAKTDVAQTWTAQQTFPQQLYIESPTNNVPGLSFTEADYGFSYEIDAAINSAGAFGLRFFRNSTFIFQIDLSATRPAQDDVMDLGTATRRFDDVYATNGTIQTSDSRLKQDIAQLTESERRVASAIKGLVVKFRFKSSVRRKGDDARFHIGAIAQDVEQAFINEGLDPGEYGMFTRTVVYEETLIDPAKPNAPYTIFHEERFAPPNARRIERLGLRYSELLCFVIAGTS